MALNYEKCDITSKEEGILLNGVNCQNTMGSGVAKAYYTKWPIVKESYHQIPQHQMELGVIKLVHIKENELIVVNCFTQKYYRGHASSEAKAISNGDGKFADSDAIYSCVKKVARYADNNSIKNVYLPRIGCGLGGLDWDTEVLPTMTHLADVYPNVEFTVCDL
jgi:O-acetyl-ADP-ribose deacetylase (regulator of RNase III)